MEDLVTVEMELMGDVVAAEMDWDLGDGSLHTETVCSVCNARRKDIDVYVYTCYRLYHADVEVSRYSPLGKRIEEAILRKVHNGKVVCMRCKEKALHGDE